MELNCYGKKLRAAREDSGKSPEEIAEALGISSAAYYDLEAFDDELPTSLSLDKVALLFTLLKIEPAMFFATAPPPESVSPDALIRKISEYLNTKRMTVSEFEDRVGWDIEPLLKEPSKILSYDIDALRDICNEIGVDWLSVVQSIMSDGEGL